MIKIKQKKKSSKKIEPYYYLKIEYTIGDADGDTQEYGEYNLEYADQLEMFCKILDKMKPLKDTWGIVLEDLERWYSEGQLSLEEYLFLEIVSNESFGEYYDYDLKKYVNEEFEKNEQDIIDKYLEYKGLFSGLITGETEYSFLVYEGYKLKYVDENGLKHNTYFE